ncbi:MAG: hypothetical protein ACYTEZ_05520 [Planctomycetota bacterium]|jgi:hypothetical protein
MRTAALLLLLAAVARGDGGFALLGIRDDPKQVSDVNPPLTRLTVDVLGPHRLLDTRRLTIRDAAMREVLFNDPFLVPTRPDLAYLVCAEGRRLRCLRLLWTTGEGVGRSFLLPGGQPRDLRPIHIVPERIGILRPHALLTLDFKLGVVLHTRVPGRPLQLDPQLNRLYVLVDHRLQYHALLATDPPRVLRDPKPLFPLPDGLVPVHAVVSRDGLRVAYVSYRPSARAGTRFVLSVADSRQRLLVRRSLPGSLRDLRWLDEGKLILTTTAREATSVHVLEVGHDRLRTTRLPERYLAPPDLVPAPLLGVRVRG